MTNVDLDRNGDLTVGEIDILRSHCNTSEKLGMPNIFLSLSSSIKTDVGDTFALETSLDRVLCCRNTSTSIALGNIDATKDGK